jgi:hypothetical protein
MTRRPL